MEVSVRALGFSLMAATALSGCYRYVPLDDPAVAPRPGAEVRAQLVSPESLRMGSVTVNDVSSIEGDVYQTVGDTIAVYSRWLHTTNGGKQAGNGAVFYLPQERINLLEQRRMQGGRSVIAAGTAAAGIVMTFVLARELGGGATPGDGNGGKDVRIGVSLPSILKIGRR